MASIALDIDDGRPPGNGLPPMAVGSMTTDMIYLTSPSRQTMNEIDPRDGAVLQRAPAPTTDSSIYAYAADACYIYFSGDDDVSRVPRARPAR